MHCTGECCSEILCLNHICVQDPVPQIGKFFFLYARPGERVLLLPHGDIVVCPSPVDIKLQGMRRCTIQQPPDCCACSRTSLHEENLSMQHSNYH